MCLNSLLEQVPVRTFELLFGPVPVKQVYFECSFFNCIMAPCFGVVLIFFHVKFAAYFFICLDAGLFILTPKIGLIHGILKMGFQIKLIILYPGLLVAFTRVVKFPEAGKNRFCCFEKTFIVVDVGIFIFYTCIYPL